MGTTQPIKSSADLALVRAALTNNRDRALFELGVGTAFRGGDLLGLRIRDVQGLREHDDLVIREQKTTRVDAHGRRHGRAARRVNLNSKAAAALAAHVADRLEAAAEPDDWVFVAAGNFRGQRGRALYSTSLTRLWKSWCEAAGLVGLHGSHTGRKSFGYLMRTERAVPIELLQKAYGHSTPAVTRAYICIQDEEMRAMYEEAF